MGIEQYLINMRPEPVELMINCAQVFLGIWIFFNPGLIALHWFISPLVIVIAFLQVFSAIKNHFITRRICSFASFCIWLFVALLVAVGSTFCLPPYSFIFAFAAGWTYIKLQRTEREI